MRYETFIKRDELLSISGKFISSKNSEERFYFNNLHNLYKII